MKRLVGLIVLLGLAAAGLYYWRARPQPPIRLDSQRLRVPAAAVRARLGDAALRVAVQAAFALHRRLRGLEIQIETHGGVVTLRGRVPDVETREIAIRVASDVPDVKKVRDEIRVGAGAGGRTPSQDRP